MHNLLTDSRIDCSWQPTLNAALQTMEPDYLQQLAVKPAWLPGQDHIFNAFTLAMPAVNYILLGESPYPRAASANGYAFWDAAVDSIWSENGLSTATNRATSLRNFIKMLLVADSALEPDNVTQPAIAALGKHQYVTTLAELFQNMLQHGFLLLNASLVLSDTPVSKEAKFWLPFVQHVLTAISAKNPNVKLLLFGKIAQKLDPILPILDCEKLICEHPYNISFINNEAVIQLFKPLHLLKKVAR